MKSKGFTLIELLAVIAIIAIISIVAIPIVVNIINSSRERSNDIGKSVYLNTVDEAIALENILNIVNPTVCEVLSTGDLFCGDKFIKIPASGKKPCKGTIIYENGIRKSDTLQYCDEGNVKDLVDFSVKISNNSSSIVNGEVTSNENNAVAVFSGTKISDINIPYNSSHNVNFLFYIINNGKKDVYLNDYKIGKVTCIPGEGATAKSVEEACKSISIVTAYAVASPTTQYKQMDTSVLNIDGSILPKDKFVQSQLQITSGSADGPYSIHIDSIDFTYGLED